MCISNSAVIVCQNILAPAPLYFPALKPLLGSKCSSETESPSSSPATGPAVEINSKQPYGYLKSEARQDDHSALGVSSGVAVAMNLKTAILKVNA